MSHNESPLRRIEPRSDAIVTEIHGICTRSIGHDQGPFILWDVSDSGLRLWLPMLVSTGEVLRLTIAKPFVLILNADVRWCRPTEDGQGFHVGVRALDNQQRLEALHKTLHLSDQRHTAP